MNFIKFFLITYKSKAKKQKDFAIVLPETTKLELGAYTKDGNILYYNEKLELQKSQHEFNAQITSSLEKYSFRYNIDIDNQVLKQLNESIESNKKEQNDNSNDESDKEDGEEVESTKSNKDVSENQHLQIFPIFIMNIFMVKVGENCLAQSNNRIIVEKCPQYEEMQVQIHPKYLFYLQINGGKPSKHLLPDVDFKSDTDEGYFSKSEETEDLESSLKQNKKPRKAKKKLQKKQQSKSKKHKEKEESEKNSDDTDLDNDTDKDDDIPSNYGKKQIIVVNKGQSKKKHKFNFNNPFQRNKAKKEEKQSQESTKNKLINELRKLTKSRSLDNTTNNSDDLQNIPIIYSNSPQNFNPLDTNYNQPPAIPNTNTLRRSQSLPEIFNLNQTPKQQEQFPIEQPIYGPNLINPQPTTPLNQPQPVDKSNYSTNIKPTPQNNNTNDKAEFNIEELLKSFSNMNQKNQ